MAVNLFTWNVAREIESFENKQSTAEDASPQQVRDKRLRTIFNCFLEPSDSTCQLVCLQNVGQNPNYFDSYLPQNFKSFSFSKDYFIAWDKERFNLKAGTIDPEGKVDKIKNIILDLEDKTTGKIIRVSCLCFQEQHSVEDVISFKEGLDLISEKKVSREITYNRESVVLNDFLLLIINDTNKKLQRFFEYDIQRLTEGKIKFSYKKKRENPSEAVTYVGAFEPGNHGKYLEIRNISLPRKFQKGCGDLAVRNIEFPVSTEESKDKQNSSLCGAISKVVLVSSILVGVSVFALGKFYG